MKGVIQQLIFEPDPRVTGMLFLQRNKIFHPAVGARSKPELKRKVKGLILPCGDDVSAIRTHFTFPLEYGQHSGIDLPSMFGKRFLISAHPTLGGDPVEEQTPAALSFVIGQRIGDVADDIDTGWKESGLEIGCPDADILKIYFFPRLIRAADRMHLQADKAFGVQRVY